MCDSVRVVTGSDSSWDLPTSIQSALCYVKVLLFYKEWLQLDELGQ